MTFIADLQHQFKVSLKHLDISGIYIPAYTFHEMLSFRGLESLRLVRAGIDSGFPSTLKILNDAKGQEPLVLKSLDLSQNPGLHRQVHNSVSDPILQLKSISTLKRLILTDCNLSSDQVYAALSIKQLEALDVSGSEMRRPPQAAVTLGQATHLRELYLGAMKYSFDPDFTLNSVQKDLSGLPLRILKVGGRLWKTTPQLRSSDVLSKNLEWFISMAGPLAEDSEAAFVYAATLPKLHRLTLGMPVISKEAVDKLPVDAFPHLSRFEGLLLGVKEFEEKFPGLIVGWP